MSGFETPNLIYLGVHTAVGGFLTGKIFSGEITNTTRQGKQVLDLSEAVMNSPLFQVPEKNFKCKPSRFSHHKSHKKDTEFINFNYFHPIFCDFFLNAGVHNTENTCNHQKQNI